MADPGSTPRDSARSSIGNKEAVFLAAVHKAMWQTVRWAADCQIDQEVAAFVFSQFATDGITGLYLPDPGLTRDELVFLPPGAAAQMDGSPPPSGFIEDVSVARVIDRFIATLSASGMPIHVIFAVITDSQTWPNVLNYIASFSSFRILESINAGRLFCLHDAGGTLLVEWAANGAVEGWVSKFMQLNNQRYVGLATMEFGGASLIIPSLHEQHCYELVGLLEQWMTMDLRASMKS